MKIKLCNLRYLRFSAKDITNKEKVESIYIRNCSDEVRNFDIIKTILNTQYNTLQEINIDKINVTDDFSTLSKISNLGGIDDNGNHTTRPIIFGSYYINDWVLNSQKEQVLIKLPETLETKFLHIAQDFGYVYIYFTDETPPNLSDFTNFSLDDYNTIYVGDGSSYYHDLKIKNEYCRKWGDEYSNKIDLWFVHNCEDYFYNTQYTYSPYLLSDGINSITPQGYILSNNTELFLIDVSFVFPSNSGYSVYGNKNSGFVGDEGGLKFTIENTTNFLENNSDFLTSDTETLYEFRNGNFYKNLIQITNNSNSNIENGQITIFGDENSKFVGKVYYIKLINNNIVKELIPCYKTKNSDIIPGLYDKYTETFYSGNDTFWSLTTDSVGEVKRYLSFGISGLDRIITENNDSIII